MSNVMKDQAENEEMKESKFSNLRCHAMNLSDESKMKKFIEAFEMNLESFEGKVVLNVGCGHGLLSMLAAKVGYQVIFRNF